MASAIKINFKTNNNNKVIEIEYKVNLAGKPVDNNHPTYTNAPYDLNEPFFYLVSFNNWSGNGEFGIYDLNDNDISIINESNSIANTILDPELTFQRTILLPGDVSLWHY